MRAQRGAAEGRQSPRVLVTDAETRAVVATCRGLREGGFEVAAAAAEGTLPAPGLWSRSVSERLVLPHPLADEAGFVAQLERRAAAGGCAALIPGSDASLLVISRARERFEPDVKLGLPPHDVVERSVDKLALLEAADDAGLSSPETVTCSGPEEAAAAGRRLGYPVVLKPVRPIVSVDGQVRRSGSVLLADEGQLGEAVPEYGELCLIQASEPGAVVSYGGVYAGGKMLGVAVSRYRRTWYPEAGNVAFSVTLDEPPGLTARVAALLDRIGWEGMFEIELIERPDGSFAAIDVNPRPYGSLALAVGAGANLPALWARRVLGEDPDTQAARAGVFYRWEDADFRHMLWQLRRGRLAAAAAVLRPHRGVVHPHFQPRDPGPFAARALFLAKTAGRRAVGDQEPGQATTAPDVRDPARAGPRRLIRRRRRPPESVAVIGAGPYGLAATAHLRGAGVPVRIFGEPLEFWRTRMPRGMMLRSRKRSTHISDPQRALTIDHFEASEGTSVHTPSLWLDEFIQYGTWFQNRVAPDVDRRKVQSVARENGGFRLTLEDGEVERADRVVVAAGLFPFPRRPAPFDKLPDALVSHSSDHDDLGKFAGSRVIVIGGGQSALESAALLHESGADVEVLARIPAIYWLADGGDEDGVTPAPRRQLIPIPLPPTDVGGRVTGWIAAAPDVFRRVPAGLQPTVSFRCIRPAGSGWLRPRLKDVPIVCERIATGVEQDNGGVSVTLDDGSARTADHVLLGTGYEIDVRKYPFLDPTLAGEVQVVNGYPVLRPGLESSVAGLHFIGAPAAYSFGPIMRFVVGTWYAAPALTRRVLGRRQPPVRFSF